MRPLAAVKHRTASAQADGACWEYTPTRGLDGPTIIMRIVLGSRAHDLEVPVCSERNQRACRWILHHHRGSREVWLLTENRSRGKDQLGQDMLPEVMPFAPGLPSGGVELQACPPEIAAELEAL